MDRLEDDMKVLKTKRNLRPISLHNVQVHIKHPPHSGEAS